MKGNVQLVTVRSLRYRSLILPETGCFSVSLKLTRFRRSPKLAQAEACRLRNRDTGNTDSPGLAGVRNEHSFRTCAVEQLGWPMLFAERNEATMYSAC